MTLSQLIDDVAAKHKRLVVYTGDETPDVATQFETRNVPVEHKSIVSSGPAGFVVLRDDDGFIGAFGISELASLLAPPQVSPWERDDPVEPWRTLYETLDDTLFTGFDRRQLLAVTREIEGRAWRVGAGTLSVTFQRTAAYRSQRDVYRRLANETDLTIHLWGADDAETVSSPEIRVKTSSTADIGRFWVIAFDAAGDPRNACALVAEELSPKSYRGFWTHDRCRVDVLMSAIDGADD